jgi:hypothetical protein
MDEFASLDYAFASPVDVPYSEVSPAIHRRAVFARAIVHTAGVDMVDYTTNHDSYGVGFVVAGLGAGIVMAAADHLHRCYPNMPLITIDIGGSIGIDKRVLVLDYIGTTFPSLFLMSSSIAPGSEYPRRLRERNFKPFMLYTYCTGLGREEALIEWSRLGALNLKTVWTENPLGDLPSDLTLCPWSLARWATEQRAYFGDAE